MDALWAPWRMAYIDQNDDRKDSGCIFCPRISRRRDSEDLIVWRGRLVTVFMNRFPYNNGHLMVVPNRHLARLSDLNQKEVLELHRLKALSLAALERAMRPAGYNLGLNLGKTAGAGVLDHIHWHLVPRWEGDTNFMPVIAETKVMPEHLRSTYKKLRKAFAEAAKK
jgi:ATP adenylyltransferase